MGPTWLPDRYAFILAAVREDDLASAHTRALGELDDGDRGQLLAALQGQALGATGVTVEQVRTIAHLLVVAERRAPGVVLGAVPEALRDRVHAAVLTALRKDEETRFETPSSNEHPRPNDRLRRDGRPPPVTPGSGEGGRRASRRPRP